MRFNLFSILVMVLALSFNLTGRAGDHCDHCGCHDACEQICRLVREDKKVNVVCWGCKCEDFCAPSRSCRGCLNNDDVCDEDCASDVCVQPKSFVWYDWEPGCARHIYTKKKLMKKTVVKTIPSYKWVVENVCSRCEGKCDCALIEPGAKIPAPPQVAARIKGGVAATGDESAAEPTSFVPVSSQSQSPWLLKSLFGK